MLIGKHDKIPVDEPDQSVALGATGEWDSSKSGKGDNVGMQCCSVTVEQKQVTTGMSSNKEENRKNLKVCLSRVFIVNCDALFKNLDMSLHTKCKILQIILKGLIFYVTYMDTRHDCSGCGFLFCSSVIQLLNAVTGWSRLLLAFWRHSCCVSQTRLGSLSNGQQPRCETQTPLSVPAKADCISVGKGNGGGRGLLSAEWGSFLSLLQSGSRSRRSGLGVSSHFWFPFPWVNEGHIPLWHRYSF